MGTTLAGQEIKNTYQGIIKISDTTALSATAKYLSDGLGNDSALALSTSQAQIGGGSIGLNFPLTLRSNVNDYTKMLDWGTDAGGSWGTMTINTASPYETILKSGEWVFQTGSTEKMRITNAGNVGIGTGSPTEKLHIVGGSVKSSNSGETFSTTLANDGVYAAGTDLYLLAPASKFVSIYAGNTERMRIDSAGNVGIGTTSPSALLHLGNNGNTSAASLLIDSSTVADATAKFAHNANVEWTIGSDETSGTTNTRSFVFSKGSALGTNDRLVITHDGNVGVGTTSPSANLEVSRSTQQTDIGAAGQVLALLNTSADITNNATGIRFRQVNGTNNCNSFIGTLSSGSSANRSSLVFAPSNSSGDAVEVMRMTPAGNVGIGTSAPDSLLHVNNLVNTAYDPSNTLASGQTMRLSNLSTTSGISSNLLFVAQGAGGGNGLGTISGVNTGTGSLALTFATRDSGSSVAERMRITSSGNVGIGTATPDTMLHLRSDTNTAIIRLEREDVEIVSGDSYGQIQWEGQDASISSSGVRASVDVLGAGDFGNTDMVFRVSGANANANVERLRITSTGNVGIGTNSPSGTGWNESAKILHIYQNDANGSLLRLQSSNTSFVLQAGNDSTYLVNITANPLILGTNGAERMRITSAGDVGIGTTSPNIGSYVAGNTILTMAPSGADKFSVLQLSGNRGYGGNQNGNIDFVNSEGTATITSRISGINGANALDGQISFETRTSAGSLTERLRIDSSGNVGIGTSSPTYKLNVVTNEVAGRQNLSNIDRTAGNLITFTNPHYSVDSSMGLMLRVFPQSDSRQGAGILASGGTANGTTDLDLFVSSGSVSSTSYSALSIKGDTGNVGIGTSSPARSLSVGGIGKFTRTLTLGANDGTTSFGVYMANEAFASNLDTTQFTIGTASGSNIPIIFAINATERVRVTTDGLTFNGDTAAANALDDYEEGTFTPSFAPTSGSFASITYGTQYGKYTKIGNRVDVNIQITVASVSVGTAGGVISITGLPFGVGAKPCPFAITLVLDWAAGKFPVNGFFNDGAANCLLRYLPSLNANDAYIGGADITSSSQITLSGTYFV